MATSHITDQDVMLFTGHFFDSKYLYDALKVNLKMQDK